MVWRDKNWAQQKYFRGPTENNLRLLGLYAL